MNKILTLDDFMPSLSPTLTLLEKAWPFWIEPPRRVLGFAPKLRAFVRVNHGRWIVDCPLLGCRGAAMAARREHRFFCTSCLHASDPSAVGRWIEVVWPSDWKAIEAELILRPVLENRNWEVGEQSLALAGENAVYLGDSAFIHLEGLLDEKVATSG